MDTKTNHFTPLMLRMQGKNYRNKGWAFNYPVSAIRNKFLLTKSFAKVPVSAWCYIPTSLPQEQAAKTSVVQIQQKEYLACNWIPELNEFLIIYSFKE